EIEKEYLALLHGVPAKPCGTVREPIGRDPASKTKMAVLPEAKGGREALSDYEVLYAGPGNRFSLARVAIHTGRTHQVRVHMRHIGHPLVGDTVYKAPHRALLPGEKGARQMLHAWKLAFTHPVSGERLAFTLPPPEDFATLAASLASPMQRIVITGSPGGGKSTLTQALATAHVPAWSADDAVKRLYEKGGNGWYVLLRRYGPRFVPNENEDVDKKALGAAMRDDESVRREVEHLIHPLVRHDLDAFWQQHEENGEAVAAAEIPLALETGWLKDELLVGVYCPFATRRKRMAETRGWSDEVIAAMESWQWPEDKKVRAANLIVDNSGTLQTMQRRSTNVLHVLEFLRTQQRNRAAARFSALWG
ncbi:dephospho-CoA kinase, partial [Desulfovibrio sp. OttesenSCG-928-O18]|nr:dephospho-CoA kinase [Desulfovibrio sp. OttesenSCG-928-O18]